MKYTKILLIAILALAMITPVIAQNDTTVVEYTFDGAEVQRLENGIVVQAWPMPNTQATHQIVAVMQSGVETGGPSISYMVYGDRTYQLRDDQVIGLWLLQEDQWVNEPALVVHYDFNGIEVRRFVNDKLQKTWRYPPGVAAYGFVTMMQAQANMLVAEHVSQELYTDKLIEHVPSLLTENFTLHYIPMEETADMTWYTPEIVDILASTVNTPSDKLLEFALDDIVVMRRPEVTTYMFDLPDIRPEIQSSTPLYDLFRFKDGKVTELWSGYDLTELLYPIN